MKNSRACLGTIIALAAVAAFAVACEDGTSSDPGSSGGPQGQLDAGPGPTADAAPRNICPPVTGAGTEHSGDVNGEETWSAAASPHILTGNVNVRSGAKLTIEPCAEVRIAEGVNLHVAYPITPNTGTLVAEGKPDQPIRFVGNNGERWGRVWVMAPGTARIAHATFEDGGGASFTRGATLQATGAREDGPDPILFLDHVTVRKSLGTGVFLERRATFVEGSQALTVTASGNDEEPYPVEIEEHALDRLPTGTYTGNKVDEILVDPQGGRVAGSGFLEDATIHDRGVPYHVGRDATASLRIGGREDEKLVTVTIEPGVVMRFAKSTSFRIQHFTTDEPSTASLRAIGTADKPIVFTSAAATPAAGDWQGLWYGGIPQASNRLDHVRIEYAGSDCGCILNTCSDIAEHEGAVILTEQPAGAFITNTTFRDITSHGITQGYDGTFVDFRPTNTFERVSGCAQTRPREVGVSCPDPRPACD